MEEEADLAVAASQEEENHTSTSSNETPPNILQHSLATAVLCLCSLSNAYLLVSVYPYAGYMVLHLLPRTTPETAGLYAGLIASSFMVGRLLTAYQWGQLADSYGRIITLQLALLFSALCAILFGTSQTLTAALIWWGFLGMSNGILSTTKTLSTEIAHGHDVLERRTMGLVIGMRSFAMLIGPAVGGVLAEPLEQYPVWAKQIRDEYPQMYRMLEKFPFILPNLVGALLCILGALAVHFLVEETLEERGDPKRIFIDIWQYCSSKFCQRRVQATTTATTEECTMLLPPPPLPAATSSPITTGPANGPTANGPTANDSIWSRPITRMHLEIHWMLSFVSTFVDQAFPLFCMSNLGGLGLAESSIGKILSGAGILFTVLQYATFSFVTATCGLYISLMIGCLLGTLPTAFIPCSLLVRSSIVSRWMLSVLMGSTKLMQSLFFTANAIAINKTVESHQRARMNALVLVGNSVSKTFAPTLAGGLVTFSFSSVLFPARYGSILIWAVPPFMGLAVAYRIRLVQKYMETTNKDNDPSNGKTVDPSDVETVDKAQEGTA